MGVDTNSITDGNSDIDTNSITDGNSDIASITDDEEKSEYDYNDLKVSCAEDTSTSELVCFTNPEYKSEWQQIEAQLREAKTSNKSEAEIKELEKKLNEEAKHMSFF